MIRYYCDWCDTQISDLHITNNEHTYNVSIRATSLDDYSATSMAHQDHVTLITNSFVCKHCAKAVSEAVNKCKNKPIEGK